MNNKRYVILDNDFIKYMLRNKGQGNQYLLKLIEELHINPVVHEFVYEHEMLTSELKTLVDDGIIGKIKYEDFVKSKQDWNYYEYLFSDFYEECNGEKLKLKVPVKEYRESDANLGEIHSVIMAMYTGYDLFLSNDGGSKTLVNNKVNNQSYHLSVKNVMDVFEEIAIKEDKLFTKKEFITLTKGDKGRKEKISRIREIWIE